MQRASSSRIRTCKWFRPKTRRSVSSGRRIALRGRPGHPCNLYYRGSFSARMAPFQSFSTISPADHGKEASLAGWVEDVRNLGGIAFLIVRPRDGPFQAPIKQKPDPDPFNPATNAVPEDR